MESHLRLRSAAAVESLRLHRWKCRRCQSGRLLQRRSRGGEWGLKAYSMRH